MADLRAFATRWKAWIAVGVAAALLAVALIALDRLTDEVRFADVEAALATLTPARLAMALGFTALSYLALTFYDVLALRIIGRPLPWRTAATASFTSYTLSHNLGVALLTGGSARYRIYTAAGLDGPDVARVVGLAAATFWIGVAAVAGLALACHAGPLTLPILALGAGEVHLLGAAVLAATAAIFAATCVVRPPLRMFGFMVPVPRPWQFAGQLLVAAIDLACASAALFVLIPAAAPALLPAFVLAYALGIIATVVTHVPGGIGVFEAVVLSVLPGDRATLLAALVAYRAIYYLLPFALGIVVLAIHEGRRQRGRSHLIAGVESLVAGLAPVLLSAAVFGGGALLLLSGALPAIGPRMADLAHVVPLPFIEASHLANSFVGTLLLMLAPGLYRNNPQLQSQRAELRALDESVIQASAPYRLGADVTASIGYSDRLQRSAFFDGFSRFEQRSMGASLSVTQLLSSGGRTAAQVSAAEADVLAGRERLRQAENQTLFQVVDSYLSVRRDLELVDIQSRSVASYRRQVDQAQAREREGDLTRTDIAQAEAQLLIIEAALAQAQASLEQSRSRFAAVVGRNPGTLEPPPPLPGLPGSIQQGYVLADRESPILWQAILTERASRHRIAAERAERHPTISAQGNFGYVNPLGYQVRDLGRTVSGGITVTVPLLTQGVVGSRVRAAIAQQQAAVFQVDDARRTVDAGLLNSWNQTVTADRQINSGEAAVAAARTALNGVKLAFAEGFRSSFELIDSEQRLLNAQVIVANARYSRYAGQATLLALLGRLQAATLVPDAPRYDPARDLRHNKAWQIGPFEPLLHVIDRPQMASDRSRPAPVPPPPAEARLAPAAAAQTGGPLARALPLPGPASPSITTQETP